MALLKERVRTVAYTSCSGVLLSEEEVASADNIWPDSDQSQHAKKTAGTEDYL